MLKRISEFVCGPPVPEELPNVYIFNNISNNYKDVELLRKTFESLECIVTEVKNQSYRKLKACVKAITKADFSRRKYIVIIILDNNNQDESIWITEDNKRFHTNGDLITAIYANRSLEGKLRFSIIQTNRDTTSDLIRRPMTCFSLTCCGKTHYPGKDVKYFATSAGCNLSHEWNPDLESPFIRILCEEIAQNVAAQKSIPDMLNHITDRVADETDELPSKVINFDGPFVLGSAII